MRSNLAGVRIRRNLAAPAVVNRLIASPHFVSALEAEPILAYSLALPLIDAWLALNRIDIKTSMPAMVGQDLRTL